MLEPEVGKAFAPDEEPVAANLVKQDLTSENNKDNKKNKRKEVKGVDAGQFAKGVIIPSTSEMDLTLAPTKTYKKLNHVKKHTNYSKSKHRLI